MAKTLSGGIEYVENLYEQIKADALSFAKAEAKKRRAAYINTRLRELETNFNDAKTLHVRILAATDENGIREKYLNKEVYNRLKDTYLDYSGELQQALLDDAATIAPKALEKPGELRLRQIELPPFAGGYEHWKPFADLFISLVHLNTSVPTIQKLHYLKTSLKGEAARLLQHISIEETNYESAWKILSNISFESAAGIQEILDTSTECLHSLKNLGIPVDSWDAILVFMLAAKLPLNTQQLWEEFQAGSKLPAAFESFRKFLETRFRTLESVEQTQSFSMSYL